MLGGSTSPTGGRAGAPTANLMMLGGSTSPTGGRI
jgi:hypothetical protein